MFFKPCSKQIQKIILATSLIRIARIREPETGTARHRNILPCEIDEATFTLSLDNAIENFASDQPHRCKATGMKFVSRDHQRSKKKKNFETWTFTWRPILDIRLPYIDIARTFFLTGSKFIEIYRNSVRSRLRSSTKALKEGQMPHL